MEKVLNVSNLSKYFFHKNFFSFYKKKIYAIDNISFSLYKGEILGFLGPNGSGKTTTIQILLNLMLPSSGKIEYFGIDFFKNVKQILRQISFSSSYVKLPGNLTIYENLDFFGKLYGMSYAKRKTTIRKLLNEFTLWQFKDNPVNKLSSGQAARVMLAKAFLPNPKIVLLDEPTAALDPDAAADVRKFILNQQKENNVSVLFTSHNMTEVTELCNRILVLKKGKIVANNTPLELTKSISVSRVQLIFEGNLDKVKNFMDKFQLIYKIENNVIEIDIEELKIPVLLNNLAFAGLNYVNISIEKPTLEDYFLTITEENN